MRIRAAQVLEQILGGRAGAGALRERVLHDFILAARSLHGAAELGVVLDRDALKRRENDGRDFARSVFSACPVLLFFAALLHNLALLVSRAQLRGSGQRLQFGQVDGDAWTKRESSTAHRKDFSLTPRSLRNAHAVIDWRFEAQAGCCQSNTNTIH